MNTQAESRWNQIMITARKMLVHARLGIPFIFFAYRHASAILNILPYNDLKTKEGRSCTPYEKAFDIKPRLLLYKAFGCPTDFKCHSPALKSDKNKWVPIQKKNQIQRASRGIHIGLSPDQAGYLIWTENPIGNKRVHISQDVTFDEQFESSTPTPITPFPGALPIRSAGQPNDESDSDDEETEIEHTGSPSDLTKQTSVKGESEIQYDIEGESDSDEETSITNKTPMNAAIRDLDHPILRRSKKNIKKPENYTSLAFSAELQDYQHPTFLALETLAEAETKNSPIERYLPEPLSFKAVMQCDPIERRGWLKAITSELKNLIIDNKTFIIPKEVPPGAKVIPTKLILKAKPTAQGTLEKLKARIVARGDLQSRSDLLDTYAAVSSARSVKLFLATAAQAGKTPHKMDFIGAFLQAPIRNAKFYVKLDSRYKDACPELEPYFDTPLLLNKSMYGLTFAGKFWNEELFDWLFSVGFVQSREEPAFWVRYNKHGAYIKFLVYTDDSLYFSSNEETRKDFEKEICSKFNITLGGYAQWFLSMQISSKPDGIIVSQARYALNIVQKICNHTSKHGVPKFRNTPLPPDYSYSKNNRPSTSSEKNRITTEYRDLDFRSAVCSILYLATVTRGDLAFPCHKLSRACIEPGLKDYEALIHLLGYIRKYPNLGNKFYKNPTESPSNTILEKYNIKPSQIVVFSDASFQDCPDDGKSTTGYMIFTAGGLIEANSSVPTPVAMSTCESEYMAAARAGMAAAHAYMIYYDYQKLGTKDYDFAQVTPEKPPIIIMTDNKAAVRLSINDMMKKGTRHIARRFHYVKEGTKSGIHTVQYCKAEDMLADIATKSQISSKSLPQLLRAMHDLPKHLRVQYGDKQSPKGSEEKQVASTTG